MATKIVPGELWVGMHVWPTVRTLLAPPICYQQPRCAIVALHWPYVEVRRISRRPGTNGIRYEQMGSGHRIHVDNLLRRDPHLRRRTASSRRARPRPSAGHEQLTLF